MLVSLLALSLGSLGTIVPADSLCHLSIVLRDQQTGQPLPGLIHIARRDGSRVEPRELLRRGMGVESRYAIHDWFVVIDSARVMVPRAWLAIRSFSGLETEVSHTSVDCEGRERQSVAFQLRRFYDAHSKGYVAGNTHLHLQRVSRSESDRYLVEAARADGLDIVFVSYLERPSEDSTYVSNRYSFDDLHRMSTEHVHYRGGQELRHNFGGWDEGYGHVLLLNIRELIRPVSIGPGITGGGTDGLPLKHGIELARRQAGTVVWAHNNWGLEDIPSWVMNRVDAMNIFDGDLPDRRTFGRAFYRYLNAGLKVPFSSGTDWFIYDFSRVYVRTQTSPAVETWLNDLKRGRSFITNGPLLEFTVSGRQPGESIDLNAATSLDVVGSALGRVNFGRLELVRNGQVVAAAESKLEGGHFRADLLTRLRMAEPGWLALRTPSPFIEDQPQFGGAVQENEFGRPLFAHTSPVYVLMRGKGVFDLPIAQGLLNEVRQSRTRIAAQGVFRSVPEHERVLAVYDEAIAVLESKIREAPSNRASRRP